MSNDKIPLFEPDGVEGLQEVHPATLNKAQVMIADLIERIFDDLSKGPLILIQAEGIQHVLAEAQQAPEAPSREWVRQALIKVLITETL